MSSPELLQILSISSYICGIVIISIVSLFLKPSLKTVDALVSGYIILAVSSFFLFVVNFTKNSAPQSTITINTVQQFGQIGIYGFMSYLLFANKSRISAGYITSGYINLTTALAIIVLLINIITWNAFNNSTIANLCYLAIINIEIFTFAFILIPLYWILKYYVTDG